MSLTVTVERVTIHVTALYQAEQPSFSAVLRIFYSMRCPVVRNLWSEFKSFAFKGNLIDLAVAVIIGAAFGKVVDSLVKHIFMPIIAIIIPGRGGYEGWTLGPASSPILIGKFLSEVVNFLVVAVAVFIMIVKVLNWLMRAKKEVAAAVPPPPPADVVLLTEIRDLLKEQAGVPKV
jgi:large conductance mechanosensitive channel